MTILGPGLTLVGGEFNSSLLAYTLHTTSPPACEALSISAHHLGLPILYVHVREYSHEHQTAFNVMRSVSGSFMRGAFEEWIERPDYLMYLDCYDNIVTKSPEQILETLADLDTDLLLAGEEHCWPDPTQVWSGLHEKGGMYLELFDSYPHIRAPKCLVNDLRFANLGGIIGKDVALFAMSDWVLNTYPDGKCTPSEIWPNDQACLHRYVLENMETASGRPHLDCGRIFFPMWNLFMGNIYPYIHLNDTGTEWPAVFHSNGHVTKPIHKELRKCLSTVLEDGIEFPIVLERATILEESPVAQQILHPLCIHLKRLVIEGIKTGMEGSTHEHDVELFEYIGK